MKHFLHEYLNWILLVLLGFDAMQNNMEFDQVDYSAEGTHVEHNVPTCVLQHLGFGNRHMVLQFWFKIILSKTFFTKKIYKSWRRVNLDVLVQHVEHDVPACTVQHLTLSVGHVGCCLVRTF